MKRAEVILGLVSALVLMLPILLSNSVAKAAATKTNSNSQPSEHSEDESSMSKSNQAFAKQSQHEEEQGEKEPLTQRIEDSLMDLTEQVQHAVQSLKCSLGFCPPPSDNTTATPTTRNPPIVVNQLVNNPIDGNTTTNATDETPNPSMPTSLAPVIPTSTNSFNSTHEN